MPNTTMVAQSTQTRSRPLAAPFRRGLNRIEAADYVGLSATKFDQLVADGRMPKAKKFDGRRVWDVRALDLAFDEIDPVADDTANPWDE